MGIVFSGILLVNVLIFALLCVSLFRLARVYSELRAFMSPVSNGQPSPLAMAIEALASSFARAAVAQAKAHLMAAKGVDARQEKALEGDLKLDMINQNPLGAELLKRYPNVGRSIRRNPALFDVLIQKFFPSFLSGVFKQAAPGGTGVPMENPTAPGGNNKPKFNL